MVSKEELKRQLEEMNSQIGTYVDYSSIDPDIELSKNKFESEKLNFETLTMLREIRDEMSLLRKNVFSDAESLISRKIKKDQELFFNNVQNSLMKLSNHIIASREHNYQSLRSENSSLHSKLQTLENNQEIILNKITAMSKFFVDKNLQDEYQFKEIKSELETLSDQSFEFRKSLEHMETEIVLKAENTNFKSTQSEQVDLVKEEKSLKSNHFIEDRIARIDAALDDVK